MFDVHLSLQFLRVGNYDPTSRLSPGCFEKAFWTPEGACTLRIFQDRIEAVGPGAEWCDSHCRLVFLDGPPPENMPHRVVREAARDMAGLRMLAVPWISDVVAGLIFQQRVTWQEATRAYRQVVERWGEVAPCGTLRMPLARQQWRSLTTAHLQSFGLDEKRATTLMRAADLSSRLDGLYFKDLAQARQFLTKIPGIGPWTREMLMGFGLGDADAVPTGDVHLPYVVSEALSGRAQGSDELMVELLEPYRGHRFRVIRWIQNSWRRRV